VIGLFGGSFDPIHHGHLIVAQVAREQLGLEVLRFVPAREQPLKRGKHYSSAEHRLAMLSLALAGTSGFAVETAELKRAGPSYTVDTLRDLRQSEPGAELVLLLGADAAAELPAWHEADRVAELARIVVFGRPGTNLSALSGISARIDVPAINISATDVRERVRRGLPVRYWVPDAVAEYISAHRLYLDPE
jgi:nicotinate-nucleotide adenylyltransferase